MSLRILVVDDAPAVRLVLRKALLRIGIADRDIFEADEPTRALDLFLTNHPEVVFLDISLGPQAPRPRAPAKGPKPSTLASSIPSSPPEQGEVLAKLMFSADPSVKIIVCTGNPHENLSVREVVKSGAFGVVEKPVVLEKVQHVFQLLAAEGLTISGSGPSRPRIEIRDPDNPGTNRNGM